MNKKVLAVLFLFICLFFFILSSVDLKPLEFGDPEEETPAAEEEIVAADEQNELTVKSFIQELLGEDYTLLIYLFDPEKLTKDLDELSNSENSNGTFSEIEIANYAKDIGDSIKEGKTLVEGRIVNTSTKESVSHYNVLLVFSDGSQKQINLDVQEAMIITPMSEIIQRKGSDQ